jgi:4-oxalocrotonate tautomerase
MPVIEVKLIEKVFTPEQKKEMIAKFTDVLVGLEGEFIRPLTTIVIEESRSGDWGVGGRAITTEAVREMAAVEEQ